MSFQARFLLLLLREWATAVISQLSQSTTTPMSISSSLTFSLEKEEILRTKMSVDGTEEELWYRIVPCGGVKLCGDHENGCSYVTSTRETRSCPSHPKSHLVKSGECPVEFIYIWPTEESDKRRWITGVRRLGGCEDENLHNHPTHAATKISSKVDTDNRRAVVANPHLKTKDLMTGKSMTIISNAINLWF